MATISVTVITKNESKNIRRCLESVKWADEIIIFDSGSTDNTVDICRLYTDQIWETDWPGYGIQKQRALEQATGDWVLSIDADEEVTSQLAESIKKVLHEEELKKQNNNQTNKQTKNEIQGYRIKRCLMFSGQCIRFANATNKLLRLVRRKDAHFSESSVHESLIVNGKVASISGDMLHYSMTSVHDMLEKMNHYTDLSALQRIKKGKRGGVWRAVLSALWMFFRVYVLNGGFLDGRAGLVLAVGFAEGAFYRYVKLYYLRSKS